MGRRVIRASGTHQIGRRSARRDSDPRGPKILAARTGCRNFAGTFIAIHSLVGRKVHPVWLNPGIICSERSALMITTAN